MSWSMAKAPTKRKTDEDAIGHTTDNFRGYFKSFDGHPFCTEDHHTMMDAKMLYAHTLSVQIYGVLKACNNLVSYMGRQGGQRALQIRS
jgi:hypothetical protein